MLSYCSDESGEWLAATRPGCLLVVRTDGSRDSVDRLWSSLDGGAQGILDGLTSAGLFATPPFVLLTWDTAAGPGFTGRAILRGDVSLRLTGENGDAELSGLGVSTWREQPFSGMTEITMECGECGECGERGGPRSSLPALPLSSGVVRVRRISLSSLPASTAAPVPVAESIAEETITDQTITDQTNTDQTITDQTVAIVRSGGVRPAPAPTPAADAVEPSAAQGYDHLFGATMMRGVEQAAVRPADDDDDAGADAVDPARHDGLTVMSGDIRTLRDSRRRARPAPEAAAAAAQPALYLLLPNGVREPLGQPIVVGRAPGVNKVSGGQIPRLVSLGGADQDISRNHVRITVEGDTVVVTDLHSRNGTVIVLPGKPPQKLRGGESTSVIVGTVVDLGGGVTLSVGQDGGVV
ncbi:FHA domain-containing protein [Cryobacterium mannosilyticum]|uniref:FHA domain-containing protein n=1 Tax=Cryobacterium mannosilyticum TaxID=1259190 RepID=A0A4R8WFF9_9MICO|nr:FHA domain-containing protein [Cryobacterium mannosilyticum]TFC07967.1 FHA domain-containing protein [Cryobacterium mannosilyticum]